MPRAAVTLFVAAALGAPGKAQLTSSRLCTMMRGRGRMSTRVSRSCGTNLAIVVASVVLGFLLTVQFRSTTARLPGREQSRLATADTVRRLEDEQKELKGRVAALRGEVTALQHDASTSSGAAPLAADVDRQKLAAGLVSLRGPVCL